MPKTQTPGFMVFTGLMLMLLSAVVVGLFMNRLKIEEAEETAPTRRIQDLVTLLKEAEDKRTLLEGEVTKLRKALIDLKKNRVTGDEVKDPELLNIYKMAGFTTVTGAGIEITLEDSKKKPKANDLHSDPNAGKLQAEDLLRLINELKAAGATAISVNDQRLVTTSEIITAGPSILVNQTRLSQPISIRAIGDPVLLSNALKIRGGILEYLDFFEIRVTLEKRSQLKVPAFKGPMASAG